MCFQIADCRINDHCLYDALRTYLIYNRSTDISDDDRHAYAAFAHCVHVLHNLSVILDYKLPYEISLPEMMKYRWTENLFDTTVFKINVSIVHLCLAHGIPSEKISFHRPFYNLFNLCGKFRSDLNADPPVPMTPCKESPQLAKIIKEEYEILTWEDTKDMDDWIKI
uniref:Protein kinase domain-containing protein n=1 Tax=Steinernema glaseri TaxID=37863 RepID=A0A1I7Z7V5_9BILA